MCLCVHKQGDAERQQDTGCPPICAVRQSTMTSHSGFNISGAGRKYQRLCYPCPRNPAFQPLTYENKGKRNSADA